MATVQNSTAGGSATHAGTNYQNRVAAWVAVHILAEQDAAPPWDLPATVTLESLQAETPNLIDDLEVRTSAAGRGLVQVKHTVNLETTAGSPLGKTVDQFVAEYSRANATLDPAKDRFVLVTSPSSSAKIRTHLPAFLSRLRTSPDPSAEWTAGSQEEQDAARILRDHVTRVWRDLNSTDPTPDELTGVLRLVRIQILDVDQGSQAEHEAKEHLRKSVLADPRLTRTQAKAWPRLPRPMSHRREGR